MKKICVVTAARSEYGVLKWLMHDIDADRSFQLQLVVTGGHLLKEQGCTINAILEDGFKIDAIVDSNLDTTSTETIAASMGRMAERISKVFKELQPDLLIVLGDRYELLPICSTAFIMRIPIAHISGGDVTEGAIDDGVRNAVTMMSDYHFPGTEDSAKNIERMRGSNKNIWVVGEPGLDAFNRIKLMTREQLADNLGLDISKKWCLMTYHSETKKSLEHNIETVRNCIECIECYDDLQVVMTYSNADFGGDKINEILEQNARNNVAKFKVEKSLGQLRYLSIMKEVAMVIGNSSSGVIEAPFIGVPVINIGNRQEGRYFCKNIIKCNNEKKEIKQAINKAFCSSFNKEDCFYWGHGNSSELILSILHNKVFAEV